MVGADIVISGHSPVGGIDIWAEELANRNGYHTDIKVPEQHRWDAPYGYKARNLDIARESDYLYVILANVYPEEYSGRRFKICYHCARKGGGTEHVKSGGCWTGYKALEFGNRVEWFVVENY